jgi:hypothetical protein
MRLLGLANPWFLMVTPLRRFGECQRSSTSPTNSMCRQRRWTALQWGNGDERWKLKLLLTR